MGITATEVYALAARFGAKKVNQQSLLKSRALEQKVDIQDVPGQTGYVTLKSGGLEPTGWLADNASLPTGGSVEPTQLYYTPKFLLTRLSLPRGGLTLVKDVKDGVRLLMEQLDTAAADVARQRGRAFFRKSLGSLTANQASVSAPISLQNVAGIRKGATVQAYNGASLQDTRVVDYVDWTSAPAPYDVYLTTDTASAWQSGWTVYLYGSYSNGPLSLEDVCANSSLYSHATTADEWNGNLDSTTTTLSETAMATLTDQIRNRAGEEIDCIFMNPVTVTRYMDLHTDQRRFYAGQKLDNYGGLKPTFRGIEIFADENVGEGDVFFFKKSDVKMHRFRKFGAETDGGKNPGMNMGAAIISQSAFAYDVQMWSAEELRVLRRNGTGHMSAITA
jgi:hypothetical protein